jgi:DNA adenine methylase
MPFYSPLRYPGGKRKLSRFLKLVMMQNHLTGCPYAEPYAGGAAVALELLFAGLASQVHINDISRSVYAFWHSVLEETEDLCSRILQTPVTMDEWYRQRSVQDNASNADLLELGFSTFFMNRTNRSGIITGGVIGGKDQKGSYKLDARYNARELVSRIRRIAEHSAQITVYNKDAAEFLSTSLSELPINALVYLDPPYYEKGKDLYENQYGHSDHEVISGLVGTIQQHWIVTYDDAPSIRQMYKQYRHTTYQLHYSAAERYRGSEIMFFCDRLEIPHTDNPARINARAVAAFQARLPLADQEP